MDLEPLIKFLRFVDSPMKRGQNILAFRGQTDEKWDLLPKGYRPKYFDAALPDPNPERITQWKAETHAFPNLPKGKSEWERIAIAQHHGLALPVLDWTGNPLVALYFAVESEYNKDGAVWLLDFSTLKVNPGDTESPWTMGEICVYRPMPIHPRIWVQNGLLSFHPQNRILPSSLLRKYKIKKATKNALKQVLSRFGFNKANIYCDGDGLADSINFIAEALIEMKNNP
jgi:hypothetical protein